MTSSTFFLIFVPILSIILLSVNFIFAPHKPYKEKKTPFECGYHSFLGQNRIQFAVSFFTFAILFLILDLEIVVIYPYSQSEYTNGVFGLVVMIVFAFIVTIGFVFEFGKGALTIDSKQDKIAFKAIVNDNSPGNVKYKLLESRVVANITFIPESIAGHCDVAKTIDMNKSIHLL